MDKQLYSTNDPSTSCTNMVNFGPVTPEIEVFSDPRVLVERSCTAELNNCYHG